LEKNSKCDSRAEQGSVEDQIDEIICVLAQGDITKKETIEWNYSIREVKRYLEYQVRNLLFREAVIRFLIGETEEEKRKRYEEEYRRACKIAGRKGEGPIEVIEWQKIKSSS